jgi:hypothetical protein
MFRQATLVVELKRERGDIKGELKRERGRYKG